LRQRFRWPSAKQWPWNLSQLGCGWHSVRSFLLWGFSPFVVVNKQKKAAGFSGGMWRQWGENEQSNIFCRYCSQKLKRTFNQGVKAKIPTCGSGLASTIPFHLVHYMTQI
ncbi:MAG: hypothetical protein AAGK82_07590, partial [Pseudomonadota bacterium]